MGKSPLLYQAALCIAAGVPFLGYKVRQGPVLYMDFENGLGQVDEILRSLAKHLGLNDLPEDLFLWNTHDCSPRYGTIGNTALHMIYEVKPALTIIDSLGSYNPEMVETNKEALRVFQDFKKAIRDCNTSFSGIHHTKKPSNNLGETPAPLEDSHLRQWFNQARGPRSLINGSDVRLGVDEPGRSGFSNSNNNHEEIALVLRGFGRVRGEIPTTYLARVYDEDGNPLGYRKVTGARLLFNSDQEVAFAKLPPSFRFKEARQVYGRRDQATNDFLQKCISAGILRKAGQGYEKVGVAE